VLQGLDLDDGDTVTFSEVKGMEGLNTQGGLLVSDCSKGKKNFVVVVPAPAATLGAYTSGGLVSEVRMPKQLAYRSLHDFLLSPGDLWEVDESKMAPAATSFAEEFLALMGSPAANVRYGRAGLLHLGFRALDEFRKTHGGALPQPAVEAEAQAFLALAEQLNAANDADNKVMQLDEAARRTALLQLAAGADATLSPMAAIVGGIAGQEVVKACTGKFHPICQGFYFDAFECLPDSPLPADEFSPAARAAAGRYGSQVSVFGSSFQKQLEELNVFLVGSGALGSIARLSPCYMHMHHAHAMRHAYVHAHAHGHAAPHGHGHGHGPGAY
jgi:ubiquitin-activating enzyme E1